MFKRILSLVICCPLVILLGVACGTPLASTTPDIVETRVPHASDTPQPTPEPTRTARAAPTPTPQTAPRIVEHPHPTLTVDADSLRASGCPSIDSSNLYGGLDPRYPAAVCWKDWEAGVPCLRTSGGLAHLCAQIVVRVEDDFRLLGTLEELKELFAPIESPDEALSYALLATGYSAKYEPEDYRLAVPGDCDPGPEHYQYYTEVLEDTHVVEVEQGYQVNLFYSVQFGCGPFPVSSVVVEVDQDGAISERSMTKLFEKGVPGPGEVMVDCCID